MKTKSWWSLNAAEWEAMKRLEFEPELKDRGKRHKGLSFGTLFKLLASILTQNGSCEQKTHFRLNVSHFRRALRWLIRLQYRIYFNPQFTSITNEKAFKSKSACWIQYTFSIALFLPFSLIFLRSTRFISRWFHLDWRSTSSTSSTKRSYMNKTCAAQQQCTWQSSPTCQTMHGSSENERLKEIRHREWGYMRKRSRRDQRVRATWDLESESGREWEWEREREREKEGERELRSH